MGTGQGRRLSPLTSTDEYLAAILDELRAIRTRLVQEPAEPDPATPVQVSEPAPEPGRSR